MSEELEPVPEPAFVAEVAPPSAAPRYLESARSLGAGRWFAWRPVKLEDGRWAWLRTVWKSRWWRRCGDAYLPEWSTYEVLP